MCSKLLDRVVSVEYALRDDGEREERFDSPRRGSHGRRGDSPYRRSVSPLYRRQPSPDYGRPQSPIYDRYDAPAYDRRRSPDYRRPRSPEYGRFRRYAILCSSKIWCAAFLYYWCDIISYILCSPSPVRRSRTWRWLACRENHIFRGSLGFAVYLFSKLSFRDILGFFCWHYMFQHSVHVHLSALGWYSVIVVSIVQPQRSSSGSC